MAQKRIGGALVLGLVLLLGCQSAKDKPDLSLCSLSLHDEKSPVAVANKPAAPAPVKPVVERLPTPPPMPTKLLSSQPSIPNKDKSDEKSVVRSTVQKSERPVETVVCINKRAEPETKPIRATLTGIIPIEEPEPSHVQAHLSIDLGDNSD